MLMIGSCERRVAPIGANRDDLSLAEDKPGRIIQPSRIIMGHNFGTSQLNGCVSPSEFRADAINRSFISYP